MINEVSITLIEQKKLKYMLLKLVLLNWSNSLTEKHKLTGEWCEPVCRVPATVEPMGVGGLGLLRVRMKGTLSLNWINTFICIYVHW